MATVMPQASVLLLQKALLKEVCRLVDDVQLYDANGNTVTGVTGYEQRLPQVVEDEDDISKFFPYAIVRLLSWHTEDDEDPWHVTLDIYFGVYDESKNSHGHEALITMLQRVADRFIHEPLLDHSYRAEQVITTEIQNADTYPYYLGGIELIFTTPKIERKVEFDESNYT